MSERTYELARGVWVAKSPEDMTNHELIAALDHVAEFASRKLMETFLMRDILGKAIKGQE